MLFHIHNSRIWTNDPSRPWVRSLTIRKGRVIEVDGPPPSGIDPQRCDLIIDGENRVVTPGLIDAHLHLLTGGKTLDRLDLSRTRSRAAFEAAIEQAHASTPADQWIIANGWSQENWGGELPDKSWLAAAGDRPVVCYRMDMHIALVNDAVLRQCNLSCDPDGGHIGRDGNGEPNGLMIEAAAWHIVNPLVPEPDAALRQQQLIRAQQHLHALGLTTVGSMEYARDLIEVYEPLRDRLTLRCRVTFLDERTALKHTPEQFSIGRDFNHDDQLAVIGYKAFIDGTLGARTARMLHDYEDDPGNRGMLVELAARNDDSLTAWARCVAAQGLSPSMHAIGDEAARIALNVIDAIGNESRPRIEHAQQLDPMDISRFQNRIVSMQPLHKADDGRSIRSRLGTARSAHAFAFRSLLDAGAALAFGSDWPVVSPDPLQGMRAAITGLLFNDEMFNVHENISVEESLRAYTSGAAFALGMDDTGVLRESNVGDLVMFDRDPFSADWAHSPPRIIMTVAAGQVVYDGTKHA